MLKMMVHLIVFICKYIKHYWRIIFLNNIFFVFRHVQLNNDSAIKFYKKFGFEIVETKEHYYKRIEPADAYVLEKRLQPKTINGKNDHHSNNFKKD